MCSGGGQQQAAPVTPAPAPAPAAPAPVETQIGTARKENNVASYGSATGPNTRADRSLSVPGSGSGLRM